jgi:ATP-binding cassette subfamily F protein uup
LGAPVREIHHFQAPWKRGPRLYGLFGQSKGGIVVKSASISSYKKMTLATLTDVSIAFGDNLLLDRASLSLEPGEKIGLIGRNGEGKTTLLKIIGSAVPIDEGEVRFNPGAVVATLEQTPSDISDSTVFDFVARGLGKTGQLLAQFVKLSATSDPTRDDLARLAAIQAQLDSGDGWNLRATVERTLGRLGLDGTVKISTLSGGWQRRASLARALVSNPDILLLDEPTNHLDIESIVWLEEFLRAFKGSLLFITHDRSFLQALATRIIDLDRGQLSSWPGDYKNFLQAKQALLDTEATHNTLFDKKLAQEEVWIRQGIKARRTRNEGRVRALKKLREQRSQRREMQGRVNLAAQKSELSGKIVVDVEDLRYEWPDKLIVDKFNCKILRGDKIGIIGPNGCGKTTLIQLLLGQLAPQQGRVTLGTRLEVAYFDQHRETIDLNRSVRENIADRSDQVTINGQPKHVISYLKNFLFTEKKINMPAKALSGGERNRLLLAKLFTRSFNFLIMDEPTNDLDMETLELLEELLLEFKGTLLLISHDRSFIDNIVTSTLVFDAPAEINEYVGGYEDWLRQKPSISELGNTGLTQVKQRIPRPRINQQDQKELKTMPGKIEQLEIEIAEIQNRFSDPEFFRKDPQLFNESQKQLAQRQKSLQILFDRWEFLED